jgi:hypothetical protein
MSEQDDNNGGSLSSDLASAAIRTGARAVKGARDVLKSDSAKRIRGGVKSVMGGIAGVTRFVQANTLAGLIAGELVLSERALNRWFSRVEPPQEITRMRLLCRPSRLVLQLHYERKLLGVALPIAKMDLPFEILDVNIDRTGGLIRMRLDEDGGSGVRGFLRPIILRLLSKAASDLLDGPIDLDRIDEMSDLIDREGDVFSISVGEFPPFVELMNREVRLLGGAKLFPFRALTVSKVRVEDGRLIVRVRLEPEALADQKPFGSIESDGEIEVEIGPTD